MDSQVGHSGVGNAIALSQQIGPHQSRGSHLAGLFKNFDGRAEADPRTTPGRDLQRNPVPFRYLIKVFHGIREQAAQFLIRGQSGVRTVVTRDGYRNPAGKMFGTEFNEIRVEAQAGISGYLLLCHATQIGEVEVALTCAGQPLQVIAALFCHGPIGCQCERRVLNDGASGVSEAGIHGQAVKADSGVPDALHDGTG